MKDISLTVQSPRGKRRRFFILIVTIMLMIGFIMFVWYLMRPVEVLLNAEDIVVLEIPKGSTTTRIGEILKENGLINSSVMFRVLTSIKGYEGRYMAGTYTMTPAMDINSIMDELIQGNVYIDTVRFTVPEGYDLRQIAELLDRKGIADKDEFLTEASTGDFDYQFLENIPQRDNRLEGYLFPDTYEIYVGEAVHSIINRMLRRFDEVARHIGLFDSDLEGITPDDIVILASIIEKEAANDEERPVVAAVFYNRLQKGYKLQSCATVEYLLDERKARLSLDDLEIVSPYNTYLVQGLPVGPIASPGIRSLKAALNPADVDYMYFVLKKDGTHSFSNNYDSFLRDKKNNR